MKKNLREFYNEHLGKLSDKWAGYLVAYDHTFSAYREQPIRLLEIGIQNGGSLEIWSRYFPNAQVLVGCDINPKCAELKYEDPRIKVVVGDANAPVTQQEVLSHSQKFDVILDDGSHFSSDIVRSFALYFPKLEDGGVYVAEDLHCSYWQYYEGGLFDPYSSIAFFKRLADVINHEHWGVDRKREEIFKGFDALRGVASWEDVLSHVHSVEFSNSVCVIRKKAPAENRLGERIVVGSVERVTEGHKAQLGASPSLINEAANKWSAQSLEEMLSERDLHIAELEAEVMRLNQGLTDLHGELKALLTSRSWSITAPLRWLEERGRSLKRKVVGTQSGKDVAHTAVKTPARKRHAQVMGLPADFDADVYLELYPDVVHGGMDAAEHYLSHGRWEGRKYHRPTMLSSKRFDSSKATVLVVSHEASRTGAPVLSLNLVEELSKRYNVVVLLLGHGELVKTFQSVATEVWLDTLSRNDPRLASFVVNKICERHVLLFAIVNSIVSHSVLAPLAMKFVPTIGLFHEFASYTRPRDVFAQAFLWSTEVVFSTRLTMEDALKTVFSDGLSAVHVIPQGRCSIPKDKDCEQSLVNAERAFIASKMRPAGSADDSIVVLGVGAVQIRKGVDQFLECAARVASSPGGENCRFVWFGHGYDPETDLDYSVYLADQIQRAGLAERVVFVRETSEIEKAYEEADIFLLSSRLDPMPNVAIDAMSFGVPVVCFAETTGIADFLIEHDLGQSCVAKYLDADDMAAKVLRMAESPVLRETLGNACREAANKTFQMQNYVKQIEQVALSASNKREQEWKDRGVISASGQFDFEMGSASSSMTQDEALNQYVRGWARGIALASEMTVRKPCPGFHPGVFRECNPALVGNADPFAVYLQRDRPTGVWTYPVIVGPYKKKSDQPINKRVALHLHAYYVDMVSDIIQRLDQNRVRPDLFVSVKDDDARQTVFELLKNYGGRVMEVQVVPNRGRDIGPLLTAFGSRLAHDYEIIGHLHTKKSPHILKSDFLAKWNSVLLENLIGGQVGGCMADAISEKMFNDESIGIVFPEDPHVVGWTDNLPRAEPLAKRLGIQHLPKAFNFPVGAMFWIRASVLQKFVELDLQWADYPDEPVPIDGTILHAIERLFGLAPALLGLRSAVTHIPGMTRSAS
ncbi:rhamnan synthesis F family protein [Hylemonella gracilis]|uniref:rhamnan synthesis F family protein n=1 Tax=Hylemonella gracilis TaxID=80880 RepID=UPI0018CC5A50|nr:rhamnan synthesis F family protein [Hylemonella gracilis]